MSNIYTPAGYTSITGGPFVGLLLPFVSTKSPHIQPFIGLNQPFVKNRGITLIELIIVLTIAALLATLAGPGLQNLVASNRLASQVNDLLADINLARSEAIRRGTAAGVCATTDGGTTCQVGGNWVNGWLVYYVCPTTDTSCTAGNNVLIKAHEKLTGNNTLTAPADALVYARTGFVSAGTGNYTLCDPRLKQTRVLNLLATGRPSLSEGSC